MQLLITPTSIVVLTFFLLLLYGAEAGYKMHWANKTLVEVKDDRCGKKTNTDKVWQDRPDSYACEDEIGSDNCRVFIKDKPIFSSPEDAMRSELCDDPYFQEAADKCRKTCATCCEHEKYTGCKDNVKTFDCSKIAVNADGKPSAAGASATFGTVNLCGSKDFRTILLYACPRTCGLCHIYKTKSNLTPGQQHVDAVKEKLGSKAKKPQIKPEKLKIPRKSGCQDSPPKNSKKGYCKKRMYRCEEGKDMSTVQKHCQLTCAVCIPKHFECKDLIEEKCVRWAKRDFCLNGDYPLSAKLHHCAKTCQMCTPKN